MRHPFWRWTGWLSIGLTGCLHGQDWRAAVTKPATRPVADRIESRPQPKVVGPFRSGQSKFVPSAEVATPPAVAARPATSNRVPQFPQEVTLPTAIKSEPLSQKTQITPVGHELPQPAPTTSQVIAPAANVGIPQAVSPAPASPSPVAVESPRTGAFAEFERTIPLRRSAVANAPVSPAEPVEVIVVEKSEPVAATVLPIITPAGALILSKPVAVQGSQSRSLEPEDSAEVDQPRGLFSKSAVPAKEMSDVTDATDATAKEFSSTDSEPAIRPRDVSVLIDQVFEDLRQRRMNDARQRTEWLKQLVRNRAPANPSKVAGEESSVMTGEERSSEPRRLDVDSQATAVEKPALETFFDDEENKSCK